MVLRRHLVRPAPRELRPRSFRRRRHHARCSAGVVPLVDSLPCASEGFAAQLDTVELPAARSLKSACEVRARVDKESCSLADGLVRIETGASAGATEAAPDAIDLAEAVLVRHLAARCRTPAFAAEASRWAATKPAPIARAVGSRIGE